MSLFNIFYYYLIIIKLKFLYNLKNKTKIKIQYKKKLMKESYKDYFINKFQINDKIE